MKASERAEFALLMTDVLAYYRQDASKFTLDLWWAACQNFTLEQVRKATTAHAMDPERGQYAPKVADIVRVLAGTHTDRAALAWGKTLEAMQRVGAYKDVVFDDPAIHAVVQDMGGWVKLCRTELKELGYRQHEFCEAHRAYTGRGKFAYARLLQGDNHSSDHDYERRGLKRPDPTFIGDPQRCREVLEGGEAGGKVLITSGVVGMLPPRLRNGGIE